MPTERRPLPRVAINLWTKLLTKANGRVFTTAT